MGLRDVVAQRKAENRPKTLAELRAAKANQEAVKTNGLAALRARKRTAKPVPMRTSPRDFRQNGILYHNPRRVNGSYWAIDVSNGDTTFTLHNRFGSWLADIRHGKMAEPARVAKALGTNVGQLEMATALISRLEAEQRALKLPTRSQLLRQHEEEARQTRARKRKTDDTTE